MRNNSGRMFIIFSDEPETDYSYDRLCDYYRAKQKENNMIHSKAKHNLGDRKEVIQFAFFPMIIESRFVWLRRHKVIKVYAMSNDYNDYFSEEKEPVYYWATVERKLIRR